MSKESERNNLINKFLVVDGSAQTAELINFWLRTEDVQIFTAESGRGALAKLAFISPDIVITNVDLPDMSGFDLCRMVKDEIQDCLVMCIDGKESGNNRLRAEEMGADDYIDTSAEHYLFLSKIRSLLRVRRLSQQLHQKYAELEETHALLNRQMEMGMQVQRALIPEIDKQFKDCALLSRYYPAMGVGGDFYTILPVSDDSFGILIGDVSGYGIGAALLTALLNAMIKNLSPLYTEPGELLFRLNNELYTVFENSDAPMYACVFYVLINTAEKRVSYVNAGQSLPFHTDTGLHIVNELEAAGHPIGMLKNSNYEMNSLQYKTGDLLLFYTDGLQDGLYKEQPDIFAQRLKSILSGIEASEDMNEILDIIRDNFYDTRADGAARMEMDDVSMILCRL